MDYAALRSELLTDPVALGYSALGDQAAADKLNATNTGRTQTRTAVPKSEVLAAIVSAEWPSTAAQTNQHRLSTLFAVDVVDANSTNVRAIMADIFSATTQTRTNLLALSTKTVSRAVELGFGVVGGVDVAKARSGIW